MENMTVKQLQDILKNLDLPYTANRKSELIDRIRNATEIKAAKAAKEAEKQAKREAEEAAKKARRERSEQRKQEWYERYEKNQHKQEWYRSAPSLPMSSLDTSFSTLGLNKYAIQDGDVARAFKRLSLLHHPDRGGNTEMQQKITVARDVLLQYGYK